jgi:hypothetical protein
MKNNILIREYRDSDHPACIILYKELAQRHADVCEDPSITSYDFNRVFDEFLGRTDRQGTWVVEIGGRVIGLVGLLDRVGEKEVCGVELFQDLAPERGRKWQSGIEILGQKLKF